jgi:hypothetical protein
MSWTARCPITARDGLPRSTNGTGGVTPQRPAAGEPMFSGRHATYLKRLDTFCRRPLPTIGIDTYIRTATAGTIRKRPDDRGRSADVVIDNDS